MQNILALQALELDTVSEAYDSTVSVACDSTCTVSWVTELIH